ncbi:MAG TPA: PIG-L family deacetylase [Steroidobacteraceae bacterium]|nr:PIG-L family deacetylase [Steroidobacteraceae bacterium]
MRTVGTLPVTLIAAIFFATALLSSAPDLHAQANDTGALPAIDANTSLLVVSPHPDDETLCCAGAIQRVLAAGGRVDVVWITSGDGTLLSMLMIEKSLSASPEKVRDLASRRMNEARAATTVLGVASSGQLFLGYPDGGILGLVQGDGSTVGRAKFTGATQVPYSDALFPGHPYTGTSLERDFTAVLDRVRPTLILAPSIRDSHPDHAATGLLTVRVLAQRGELSKARYWIVHGGEGWPAPRGYMPGIPLGTPPRGKQLGLRPFVLTDAEVDRKLQAVRDYQTQMRVMAPFLLAFVRTSELYSALPAPSGSPSAAGSPAPGSPPTRSLAPGPPEPAAPKP